MPSCTSSGFDSLGWGGSGWGNNCWGSGGWGGGWGGGGWGGGTTFLPSGCILKCPPGGGGGGFCPPGCCPCPRPPQPWPPTPWPPIPWPPPPCPPTPCPPTPWPPYGGGGCCGGGGGQNCPPGCCPCNCPPGCCPCGPNNNCGPDAANCPRCPWQDNCSVFGGMFRSGILDIDLTAGTSGTALAMDAPLPLQNVGFSGNNTLTIQCSGTYELTFFGNFTFSNDSHLTFYVNANGTRLTETVVEKDVAGGIQDSFERSVIVHLCANTFLTGIVDVASLANGGDGGRLTIPANGVHLEVIRIGA